MKIAFRIYAVVRMLIALFFFYFFWLACHYHLSWSSAWVPLEGVALLVLGEEVLALLVMRGGYFAGIFKVPSEVELPATVFEGDRTFVEVLCAVAAGVLAIALGDSAITSRVPAKVSLTSCVILCFLYLNLQGASVREDVDEKGKHLVKLMANRSPCLLIVRNAVYWTFLYGLIYTVIKPK
jgi:hypothetical protein